jgi:hypothetical protein
MLNGDEREKVAPRNFEPKRRPKFCLSGRAQNHRFKIEVELTPALQDVPLICPTMLKPRQPHD